MKVTNFPENLCLVFDASEIGLNAFYALIVMFYSSHTET